MYPGPFLFFFRIEKLGIGLKMRKRLMMNVKPSQPMKLCMFWGVPVMKVYMYSYVVCLYLTL